MAIERDPFPTMMSLADGLADATDSWTVACDRCWCLRNKLPLAPLRFEHPFLDELGRDRKEIGQAQDSNRLTRSSHHEGKRYDREAACESLLL